MILPINHVAGCKYIRQPKNTQINKYVARENNTRIDHNYRVGDKFMSKMRSVYQYKTLCRGHYEIFRTCTNGKFTLQTGAVTHRINICNIKPYNYVDVE